MSEMRHATESSAPPRKVGLMSEMRHATGLPMEAQLCIQGCLQDHRHQPHRHSRHTDLILLAFAPFRQAAVVRTRAELPRRSDWRLCADALAVSSRAPPTFDPREARCVSSARQDLCGGRGVILVPAATINPAGEAIDIPQCRRNFAAPIYIRTAFGNSGARWSKKTRTDGSRPCL
jgi:hypothetical protein